MTATMIIGIVAYHENCYSKDLKGATSFLLDNTPINGFAGNVVTVISVILGMLLLFLPSPEKYLSLLALIPIVYRLVSYVLFERKLI
ncbi:hypothetical protein ACFSTA_00940 [Ornithinibacillus salinisoli]|uniref:DUF3784 domain-containing protein n=1 Tax=Ornithinibacillus salinisoli TaxID=1848459 RepID=A0ABW4VUM8_9BACI